MNESKQNENARGSDGGTDPALMPDVSSLSEYYFSCRVDAVPYGTESADGKNKISESEKPRLYLEREYGGGDGYILYAVFPCWLELDEHGNKRADRPPYDRARIIFDRDGISPFHLPETPEADITVGYSKTGSLTDARNYVGNGYRADIIGGSGGMYEFSGVGKIECFNSNDKNTVCSYVFYANFTFRQKICYTAEPKGETLKISATVSEDCKNDIPVKLLLKDENVPCLISDERSAAEQTTYTIGLSEGKRGRWSGEFKVPRLKDMKNPQCRLAFADSDDEKYYILECRTLADKGTDEIFTRNTDPVCPYCHKKIDVSKSLHLYRSGGVACDGERTLPEIRGDKRVERNCMYCRGDITGQGNTFVTNYNRLLPADILARESFSIALYGSRRSGKTTLISRIFNVRRNSSNQDRISMDCAYLRAVTSKLRMKSYQPVKIASSNDKLDLLDPTWAPLNIYGNYIIEPGGKKFPTTTESAREDDILYKSPFTMTLRNRAYVHFYDISGEDAEKGSMRLLGDAGNLGVFLVIDVEPGKKDGNRDVVMNVETNIGKELSKIKNKNLPVAVIVTKFDKHEKYFTSSSHCLRGDVADMFDGIYSRSELEFNVNGSSEEIKTFIKDAGYELDNLEVFRNVKYFGVSSFSNADCLFHKDGSGTDSEMNKQLFNVSPKRLELPLLWMLHSFGLIR